jgi:O-antigen/teichoic acid export membrane protein
MNKLNLLLRGSALQTLEALVSIVVGFITLPLMLQQLGDELYGVWVLVGGFTALLYIFDLGFSSSVTRSVASTIAIKNYQKTNQIINSSLLIYSGLAFAIMLLVSLIAIFYKPDISHIISRHDFVVVVLVVGLSIAIEFPFKAFAGLTSAHLRYDLIAYYRITTKIVGTLLLIYLLFNDYGLVAIAVLQFIMGLISNLFFIFVARNVYKEMKIDHRLIESGCIKELFHYSSWAFLIDVNRLLKERIDLFFVGAFVSLSAVNVYYVPVRLTEYSLQLLQKGLNLSLPILTANISEGDNEKFRENMLLFSRINTYFAVLTFVFFLFYGKTIIYYWMGTEFDYQTAHHILLMLLGARLSALSTHGISNALYAQAKHQVIAYIQIGETIFTSILLYILVARYELGALAAAISIAIPMLIGRLIVLPIYALRKMEILDFWPVMVVSYRPFLLGGIALLIYQYMAVSVNFSLNHLICGLLFFVGTTLFVLVEIRDTERNYLYRIFSKFLKSNVRNSSE